MRQVKTRGKKSRRKGSKSKKAKSLRKIKIIFSSLLVALALISFLLTSTSGGNPKSIVAKETPSATPGASEAARPNTVEASPFPTSVKATQSNPYTQVDSMAILGGFTLARQTPSTEAELKSFISKLKASQNSLTPKIDLGIKGNVLVGYVLSPKGFNSDVCYAVKAPKVEGQTPTQDTWVTYYSPAKGKESAFVMIAYSVTTCAQAKAASKTILTAAKRQEVSKTSHDILDYALSNTPSVFFTPLGLALLDESRGFKK